MKKVKPPASPVSTLNDGLAAEGRPVSAALLSHDDVHAMIEVAALAHEAGCPISVLPADDLRENNGDRTEFCIGGPMSNSVDRFCLIVQVTSADTYGDQAVELVANVTDAAFTAHRRSSVATGRSPQN
jgi:hypothetical protein